MPQMSPLMWIVFPFVMVGLLIVFLVMLGLECQVVVSENVEGEFFGEVEW